MARLLSYTFFALVLMLQYQNSTAVLSLLMDIVDLGEFIYDHAKPTPQKEVNVKELKENNKLQGQMNLIMQLTSNIYEVTKDIKDGVQKVPKLVLLEESLDDISEAISAIDDAFIQYLKYKNMTLDKNNHIMTIENFAHYALDTNKCGISQYLSVISSKLVLNSFATNKELTVLYLMVKYMQDFQMTCHKNKSPNMILYDLYSAIAATETKAYVIIKYALEVLNTYDLDSDYTRDLLFVQNEFQTRHDEIAAAFKIALDQSSRAIRTCDPMDENSIYELDNTRRVIIPKGDAYYTPQYASCEYEKLDSTAIQQYVAHARKSRNLAPIDIDRCDTCGSMTATYCAKSDNIQLLRPEECLSTDDVETFFDDCLCTCYSKNSEIHISILPVFADIDQSKVITGVRINHKIIPFADGKERRLFFLEIREGNLLSNGTIDSTSLVWKNSLKNHTNLKETYEYVSILHSQTYIDLFAQDVADTAYELPLEKMNLLVGLQFKKKSTYYNTDTANKYIDAIHLQSYFSIAKLKHNSVDVQLDEPKSLPYFTLPPLEQTKKRKSLADKQFRRFNPYILKDPKLEEVKIATINTANMDSPRNNNEKSQILSMNQDRIQFQLSGDDIDAGQTIIPFIDLQPVVTDPPTPLTGAALYYKASRHYGGYLAVEISSINYGTYMGNSTSV